jgi:hypothetical protein
MPDGMPETDGRKRPDNAVTEGRRTGAMTLGRSFLLWLLGVLVVTLVMVSGLVLWHEKQILENELRSRSELFAHVLGLAAIDGNSDEYDLLVPATDVRAGEVTDPDGHVLWRYGPSLVEFDGRGSGLLPRFWISQPRFAVWRVVFPSNGHPWSRARNGFVSCFRRRQPL